MIGVFVAAYLGWHFRDAEIGRRVGAFLILVIAAWAYGMLVGLPSRKRAATTLNIYPPDPAAYAVVSAVSLLVVFGAAYLIAQWLGQRRDRKSRPASGGGQLK